MGIDNQIDFEIKKYSGKRLFSFEALILGPAWFIRRRMYVVGFIYFLLSIFFLIILSWCSINSLFLYVSDIIPESLVVLFVFVVPIIFYLILNVFASLFFEKIYRKKLIRVKMNYWKSFDNSLNKILIPDNKNAIGILIAVFVFFNSKVQNCFS